MYEEIPGHSTHDCHQGTDKGMFTACPVADEGRRTAEYGTAFAQAYQREFGFVLDRPILVDDIRVRATAVSKVRKIAHGKT